MNEKKKFYQKKWFLWLCLIIFPPIGILLLWAVHKTIKKRTKIILSVIFALWFLILMNGTDSEVPADTMQTTQHEEDTAAVEESSAKENTEMESPTEEPAKTADSVTKTPPHREGMAGISNKDINNLNSKFTALKVNNDVTGNWRITCISESIDFEEYALSYYHNCFTSDDEIHAIVNFAYNTTTKIAVIGDKLDITVYEYLKGEEHDAKALFGGMFLSEYCVYIDNGDIDKFAESDNSNVDSSAEATSENFISDIKGLIDNNTVTDVILENSNLCIYVDTNTNTTTLPIENWATIQAISITDNILSLSTQYDVLWETITVDFGEAGKIVNNKSDMDGYGRCFLDFVLE